MKLKFIKFIAASAIAATAIIGMASFVSADEDPDEGRWRVAKGGSCDAYCYYKDGSGNSYAIKVVGTFTDCPQSSTQSSCETTACSPVNPCSTN
jgi:hypothetical protein